jgi:hypothetical protein
MSSTGAVLDQREAGVVAGQAGDLLAGRTHAAQLGDVDGFCIH